MNNVLKRLKSKGGDRIGQWIAICRVVTGMEFQKLNGSISFKKKKKGHYSYVPTKKRREMLCSEP